MDIPDDTRDLYAAFGFAAERAQLLELDASNVALTWLAVWYKPECITPEVTEMFRGVLNDLDRKTLGALLESVKSTGTFSDDMLNVIDTALEARNYLTHRFFKNHNFAIFSSEGRRLMIAELEELCRKIEHGSIMLVGVASCLEQLAVIDQRRSADITEKLTAAGVRVPL